MGIVEGNQPATDNDWESVKKGGDAAIEKWIDGQLSGKTCTIVLIGSETAKRKWIDYEIHNSWNSKKGVLGIYVHKLKNVSGFQATRGTNPFAHISMKRDGASLSAIVKAYDPPYSDSKECYDHIKQNLAAWIEEAIKIRNEY
jgi:hypothetical protein